MMKSILYISLPICFLYGFFWRDLPKGSYYILNALFIFYICLYMFLIDRKSFIKFYLVSLSIGNLLDEWLFDNTTIGYNEYLFVLILPILWLIINKSNAGKNIKQRILSILY
jgi:hypothetical protein